MTDYKRDSAVIAAADKDLIEKLRAAADDPMWANQVEVSKSLLRAAVERLAAAEARNAAPVGGALDAERERDRSDAIRYRFFLQEKDRAQQAGAGQAVAVPEDKSMPRDLPEAKRWVVQLRARVDSLLTIINAAPLPPQSAAQADDATRYRWMRKTFLSDDETWPDDVYKAKTGEQLDKAIDAAIAKSK